MGEYVWSRAADLSESVGVAVVHHVKAAIHVDADWSPVCRKLHSLSQQNPPRHPELCTSFPGNLEVFCTAPPVLSLRRGCEL